MKVKIYLIFFLCKWED